MVMNLGDDLLGAQAAICFDVVVELVWFGIVIEGRIISRWLFFVSIGARWPFSVFVGLKPVRRMS